MKEKDVNLYFNINSSIFLIFSFSTDIPSTKTVLFNETAALSTTEASEIEENAPALLFGLPTTTIAVFLIIVIVVSVILKLRKGNQYLRG